MPNESMMRVPGKNILQANWIAPSKVNTLITQKNTLGDNGLSQTRIGFNLASHVGDESDEVLARRALLKNFYLPNEPFWLNQTHGSEVLCLDDLTNHSIPKVLLCEAYNADASFTFQNDKVCVISTADCLPILLTDIQGHFVAVIHAGWQGIHNNIIACCVEKIRQRAKELDINLLEILAYIGPSISKDNYQVDEAFYQRFMDLDNVYQSAFVKDNTEGRYLADLKGLARFQLVKQGVNNISDSGICSYESEQFYSHRRATHLKEQNTGRFASLIWKSA